MKTQRYVFAILGLCGIVVMVSSATPAFAETKCDMSFRLEGWSAFYKTAHGSGVVTCDNGQSRHVVLQATGGGVTFGTEKIVGGHGDFSPIDDIDDIYGDYANAEAHAGAGKSAGAQVVTKGTVSLALSGKGHGVDLGFSFGKFTISHARRHHRAH